MSRLLTYRKVYDCLIILALISACFALVSFPQESIQAASEGLSLCAAVIIPSLFPFFVLSTLMVRLGMAQYFGRVLEPVMRPLFNVSGACSSAFVLGFVGGYPVGAKMAISLFESGCITKSEAERLLAFSNNSGPAFILGFVGVGIFASSRVGLLLYLAHALASILVGILFRRWGASCPQGGGRRHGERIRTVRLSEAFVESVRGAVQSVLSICGFVVFFAVLIRLLFLAGVIPALSSLLGTLFSGLGFDAEWASMLLIGLIELSSGVWSLSEVAGQIPSSIAMAAFMLGWAGLSVHCQVLSFIGGSGLGVRSYILGKILHGFISAGLVFLLTRLLPFDIPVAATLAEGVQGIAAMDFSTSIRISTLAALGLLVSTLLICYLARKRVGR